MLHGSMGAQLSRHKYKGKVLCSEVPRTTAWLHDVMSQNGRVILGADLSYDRASFSPCKRDDIDTAGEL